ncbi:MAG: hypothetical protein Q8936_05820 [Bacillota bacterium]|nr:hypothetical protein [Bacillota bacterium]
MPRRKNIKEKFSQPRREKAVEAMDRATDNIINKKNMEDNYRIGETVTTKKVKA